VVIVNVALVAPDATVTTDGTVAAEALLLETYTASSVEAAPFRVIVPVADVPPTTVVGVTVTDEMAAGFTVSKTAELDTLP
jgi:hypothetical protein